MSANIYVGTSGWTYDHWRGRFYPETLPSRERLAYYARCFNAVEVNATYYRYPTDTMVRAWNRTLPRSFHMVVKGHRGITHRKKLAGCDTQVGDFLEHLEGLRPLRAILWQLPPQLHRDVDRLDAFLAGLPRARLRHAVEFRHESWWRDEVVACLRRHRAAFVAVSAPGLPDDVIRTGRLLYLRFHGLGEPAYSQGYSRRELLRWVERVRPHLEICTLYAFFNNDWEAHAPRNAATFADLLESAA